MKSIYSNYKMFADFILNLLKNPCVYACYAFIIYLEFL